MKRSRSRRTAVASMPVLAVVALLVVVGDRADAFSCPPRLPPTLPQIQPSAVEASTSARPLDRPTTSLFSTPESEGDVDSDDGVEETKQTEVMADSLTTSQIESLQSESKSFLSNLKDFLTNKSKFNRESLGKLGMSALLAYGFVSNVSGVLAVSSAWFIFSKRTGTSPMAPGQWPAFMAVYAGFMVMLNVVRPARFAFSMAISPYFERIRKSISRRFGVSPRGAAVLMIVFINLLGTSSLMALGVGLASALSGVPVWAGR